MKPPAAPPASPNENIKVKIEESVRGGRVHVQTAVNLRHALRRQPERVPADEASELTPSGEPDGTVHHHIALAPAPSAAASPSSTIPYYPYVRSDKKDEPPHLHTARLMGQFAARPGPTAS